MAAASLRGRRIPLRAGTLYVVRMTRPEPHELTVPLRDGSAVSALLLVPAAARAGYVLAHGAGAGMSHPFMTDTAEQLADRGIATFRYQFPYMERGARRPDPPRIAHATVRAAVAEAARQLPGIRLFAGGKSFGGRMTSQAQAEAALAGIEGLVFLGFPLHPAKLPSLDRAQHLANVRVPDAVPARRARQPCGARPDHPGCRGARCPSDADDDPRCRSLVPCPGANRTHGCAGPGRGLRCHRGVGACALNGIPQVMAGTGHRIHTFCHRSSIEGSAWSGGHNATCPRVRIVRGPASRQARI